MRGLAPLEAVLAWFPRHARWVLAAVLIATAASALVIVDPRDGAIRLEMDASADRLLPSDDPARRLLERVQSVFGKDETLIVALADAEVFRAETLERIQRVTRRIEALEGVDRVLSLANASSVRSIEGDVHIGPIVGATPRTPAAMAALRREVLADPLVGRGLVSGDGRVTAILVYFLPMSHREYRASGLDAAIQSIAEEERGEGEVWITGGPHIRAVTADILLRETFSLSVGILAALGAVLALAYRTLRGVWVPLATVAVAVVWTFGVVAAVGRPLNAITALVGPLLTAIGLSYAVHVVTAYYHALRESSDERHLDVVARSAREVALPVCLTGLTTAAGLASLLLSPLVAVREFGAFTVVGVLCTVVASLTFTPSALAVLGRPRRAPRSANRAGLFERFVDRVAHFDVTSRPIVFGVAAGAMVLSVLGASTLRVGTRQIEKFYPDAPVRSDFENVNRALDGANPLYVVLSSDESGAFKDPDNLREIESLQSFLVAQPEVGAATSVVDFLSVMNQGFQGGDPAERRVPDSRRLVGQLLLFGAGDELDRYVDADYRMVSIHVRARVLDSEDVGELVRRIEGRLAELPGGIEGHVTGTAVVLTGALDDVVRSQTLSLLAAFGIIYAILAAMFLSWRIGAIALVPNALPVAAYFGALGVAGVRLDPATSLVAPMVIGIAVDDTIHYFARFISDVRRTADEERATHSALRFVGRPVTITTLALCAGFLVLTTSELRTNAELGLFAAFALAMAWATDFFLTPALCSRLRIATLWDVLSVDLGHEPHREIRLFHGLSPGQARVVAVLAERVRVRRGDRLYGRGEPGDAVYAVVDGRLRASVDSGERRVELASMARGDTVGEIGLLHLSRSADVDALEDTVLIRLTQASLDTLTQSRPRIAARLYRTLSAVAAERLLAAAGQMAGEGPRPAPEAATAAVRRAVRALAHAFYRGEEAEERRGLGVAGSAGVLPELRVLLEGLGLALDEILALQLVPLAAVAWADERLDPRERAALEAAARELGAAGEKGDGGLLARWLDRRPSDELIHRWAETVAATCEVLSVEGRLRLRESLLGRAHAVAAAAGGFLGLASVSRHEEAVLERLGRAFAETDPHRSREELRSGPGAS